MDSKTVAIIGGGPAGLMAAEILSAAGIHVDVYDTMPSLGRKFLIAGKGGLNLTHSEPYDKFVTRYASRQKEIKAFLDAFKPENLRQWAHELGAGTFVGTSGRVFPKEMKAASLLRAWLKRLREAGMKIHTRHKWLGWDEYHSLRFETPSGEAKVHANAVILAMGGGSWSKLGSTGEWVSILQARGVELAPLKPANCGFNINWTEHFRTRFEGQPLKSVVLSFQDFKQQGEFIITTHGVEGSLIYAASSLIRDEIESKGSALLHLDLAPDSAKAKLAAQLSRPRGKRSMSSHLEKTVGIKGVKAGLLWEFVPREDFNDPDKLASAIKDLPIPVTSPRPMDEAISTAGGVKFEALNEDLMIKRMPGVFCAGEMLDWEAPTGGYLLTACFATGRAAGLGALKWMENNP